MTKAASTRFKFLRCLILCLGFASTPMSVLAQVVTTPLDLNDSPQAVPDNPEGETTTPSFGADLRMSKPRELTFQYLDSGNLNTTELDATSTELSEAQDIQISQAKKAKKAKTAKKAKKAKTAKRGKKSETVCEVFFQGSVSGGSSITATGEFTSETLIQIFEDETSFSAGETAIQTIEYEAESIDAIAVGDQLGALTVTSTQSSQLTFEYLSTTDTNYTDIVTSQSSSTVITGTIDDDSEAYVVISNGKGGKCGKGKKAKKCKRGKKSATVFSQGTTGSGNVGDCPSETLVEVFESSRQVTFTDITTTYWAYTFISRLASYEVISGFPGGMFMPDTSLTYAHFASIVSQAFSVESVRETTTVTSVSSDYWAYNAIQEAYTMGFIDIPTAFNPNQVLTKLDVLVAIARGLGYTSTSSDQSIAQILSRFTDADTIPAEYQVYIAALAERGVLVNYPQVNTLNITETISRAETSALIYQALTTTGQVEEVMSDYVIK